MKKKLFAVLMSASMVLSFMPSLAFATGVTYSTSDKLADSWRWTPGSQTATLIKATSTDGATETTHTFNAPAKVTYLDADNGNGEIKTYPCGQTKNVKVRFVTENPVGESDTVVTSQDYEVGSLTFNDHVYKTTAAKAATCEKDGNYEYKECTVCGDFVCKNEKNEDVAKGNTTIPAKGHHLTVPSNSSYWVKDNNKLSLKKEAPLKCEDCGKTFNATTVDADKLYVGADAEIKVGEHKDATCTEPGKTVESADVVIPHGRLEYAGTTTRPEKDLTVKYVKETVTDPATGHVNKETVKELVWSKNDETPACNLVTEKCTDCGKVTKSQKCEIKLTSEANCTSTTATYEASLYTPEGKDLLAGATGGKTKTYTVKAKDHDYKYVDAKAATCKEDGYKAHYECKNCDAWFTKNEITGKYSTVNKDSLKETAQHELVGDFELSDAQKGAITGSAAKATDVVVKNVHCKNCDLKFNDGKTITAAEATVDTAKRAELNKDKKPCDEQIIPVNVKWNGTLTSANVWDINKYANDKAGFKATTQFTVKGKQHNYQDVKKFVWNTEDPENVTCKVVFQECKDCGAVKTSQPAKVEVKKFEAPKCGVAGKGSYVATYNHSNGEILTQAKDVEFKALEHKFEKVEAKAATCTEDGYTAHKKCSVCGHEDGKEVLKATGHDYWVVDKATCTKAGLKKCTKCGDEQAIAATGHDYKDVAAKAATCTETGYTAHKVCSVCGEKDGYEVTAALGHDYKVEKAATCTEDGVEKCTRCDATKAIAAKGHKYEVVPAVEATCTEKGHTAGVKCSVCGNVLVATAEIAAKGHTLVDDAAVDATVFATGLTAGKHCSVCNHVEVAQETVAKAKYAVPTVKAGKKLATVTVKSTKGAVKYQISYKKAGGKYVTKTVKAGKKVTIKKLAKGKKYTFKAVAINADGVKATSAVKTVKIK